MNKQTHSPLLTALHAWRSTHTNLDAIRTLSALAHDLTHAVLGLGVTLEEEEIVLNCFELISGRECSPHMVDTCTAALAQADINLIILLGDFINGRDL